MYFFWEWYHINAAFFKIWNLYNRILKTLDLLNFLFLVLKEGVFALATSNYACLGVVQNFSLNSNLTIF